jgi:hypothetical protein
MFGEMKVYSYLCNMRKVNVGVWHSMLRLLEISWADVIDYSQLSLKEKKLITKIEFDYLIDEITTLNEEKKKGVKYV